MKSVEKFLVDHEAFILVLKSVELGIPPCFWFKYFFTDHYDNIANSYWPGAEDIDNDNFLTEDHHVNHVYEFVNQLGLYADDICALFASLADLTAAVNVVNKCLLRFSLRMHYNAVGSTGKSKSVCMWFRTANVENPRELPLPPPIHINSVTIGNTTYPDGEVTFVHKQKYLGTWLTTDGNDNYVTRYII